MPDQITSDPASPAPAATAPKVHRSIQNQAIQNYIGEAETFITTVKTDTEVNPVMATHGYDAAELTTGDGLLKTAANSFGVRLTGMGGKTDKHGDLMTSEENARNDYAAFRSIACAAFPAQADRVSLGLTANVPQDLQKFVTLAHTSYTNAAQAPWTTKMTKRNYAPAHLTTVSAALDALASTESDSAIAAGEAQQNTQARGAFRGNAGALTKLKL